MLMAKNRILLKLFSIFFIVTGLFACKTNQQDYKKVMHDPVLYTKTIKKVTDAIVHDIFSPPQATRIYAYTTVAGYEAMVPGDSACRSLVGQLNGLDSLPGVNADKKIDYQFAAMLAAGQVGKAMVFSEDSIQAYLDTLKTMAKESGMQEDVYNNTLDYANQVGKAIINWSKKDHYAETRSATQYTINEDPSRWKPTQPAYMQAVEPHWNQLRTFVIDSAGQFRPQPLPPFDTTKGSPYYQMEYKVYKMGVNLTEAQKDTANFWDCNPYKLNISGHVMYATKKISPPGHWMNICGILSQKSDAGFSKTILSYAKAAVAMADGAISCWDQKYLTMELRPETYINAYIDPDWRPFLQTPPFPDYTSAHSVMSAAAALMLTSIYGENFSFHDDSEMEYGAGEMDFSSVKNAADVAAISRFYGGIHTMEACMEGMTQGKELGTFLLANVKMVN